MKYLLIIVTLSALLSCAANNSKSIQSESKIDSVSGLAVFIRPDYKLGDNVVFSVENASDKMIYIHQPSRLNIERKVDTIWKEVRLLPCPCGAPCAPPSYMGLEPYEMLDLNWNQKESWCKEDAQLPGSDTSAYVKKGHYRFVIITNDSNEKDQNDDVPVYAPFEIN